MPADSGPPDVLIQLDARNETQWGAITTTKRLANKPSSATGFPRAGLIDEGRDEGVSEHLRVASTACLGDVIR
jgi:hypothetical protein